jgi:gas vesicle protein
MSSESNESANYETDDSPTGDRGSMGIAAAFFMLGVGFGAVAAMLMTPKTGPQMRRILRRRYEDARDSVGDFADEAQDRMGETLEKGERWVRGVADAAAEKMGR